jgi:hypothetical protein
MISVTTPRFRKAIQSCRLQLNKLHAKLTSSGRKIQIIQACILSKYIKENPFFPCELALHGEQSE